MEPRHKPAPLVRAATASSISSSDSSSLRPPRTPRFAEATTVHSPVDAPLGNPFQDPPTTHHEKTNSYIAQEQVGDMGFGYINNGNDASRVVDVPATPASPLKSALRAPGTPGRILSPMSATFREEQVLEKQEAATEKEQAKDLKIKTRVRMAKMVLRCTNFSCSLIVLALLSSTFAVFNATKSLPPRNNLPAWANGTKTWPQILVLVVACISLALCLVVFWNYWRGGHRRAEKVAVYYTLFAVGFFIFSVVMWGVAAGVLQSSKNNGNNKDMWGWSCVDNKRRTIFQDDVNYALVCRMQNWSLVCCIIEIVVETITIAIYAVVFYRYYTKNRLRKSMAVRDRARSDLYLAQLRSQSAPNTPGFGPLSPSYNASMKSPMFPPTSGVHAQHGKQERDLGGYEEAFTPGARIVDVSPTGTSPSKPFALQKPPIRIHAASPKIGGGAGTNFFPRAAAPSSAFTTSPSPSPSSSPQSPPMTMTEVSSARHLSHAPIPQGERTYEAVPIPGAYRSPLNSPGLPVQQMSMSQSMSMGGMMSDHGYGHGQGHGHQRQVSIGEAVTSDVRVESPPSSPPGSPRGWR